MDSTATQQGADSSQNDPDVKKGEVPVQRSDRDIALDAMAARQEQARIDEIEEARRGDPGFADQQDRFDREYEESNAESRAAAGQESDRDGAASRETIAEPEPKKPDLPSNLKDDPLADFIEMRDGAAMVKAKVNGQDRLIPLADAKRQLQIGVAAEVRMQSAAEREKQIEERERRLQTHELALRNRVTQQEPAKKPTTPAQPDLSDEELLQEATDIFNTAFSGTEEDAAKKLAKTLSRLRASATPAQTQQIDPKEIARMAASMAYGSLTAESKKKDVQKGFAQFKTNYPEILSDTNLFKMADEMTDGIEREHPEWDIAQVMDEAGKRTREWVDNLRGDTSDTGDNPPPRRKDEAANIATDSHQTRQERKAGLVRIPRQAAGAQHDTPEPEGDGSLSPQESFLELKKARGQAV